MGGRNIFKNQKEVEIQLFRRLTKMKGRLAQHCYIAIFNPTNENQHSVNICDIIGNRLLRITKLLVGILFGGYF